MFERLKARQITTPRSRVLMTLWTPRVVPLGVKNSMCLLTLSNFTRRNMSPSASRARLERSGFAWSKGSFHELAHIGRHMIGTSNEAFVDHLSLHDVQGVRRDPREAEADEWAENGLIPEDIWNTIKVK